MVAFVTLLLAGESFCLVTTKSKQDYQQAKSISIELQETILELSASLRNGERDKFESAKVGYAEKVEAFSKYANGSNVYEKLKSYQVWLDSAETEKLIDFNAEIVKYNGTKTEDIEARVGQIRDLQLDYSKTTSEDVAKLLSLAERAKECASYCFADDYEELEEKYQELSQKLNADWDKINNEYAARLQSEALIDLLEAF